MIVIVVLFIGVSSVSRGFSAALTKSGFPKAIPSIEMANGTV